MASLAMSAREQIQQQVEKEIEPKLELLLAQKVKPHAIRKKENKEPVFRKERNVKRKSSNITSATKKQFKKTEPEVQGKPEDNASSLFRFAKEKFGVELNFEQDRKPAAAAPKPSGKGSTFRGRGRGNTKFLDCYSMDIAPMNIFENQCIPVRIHNLSKSFRPNLNTIRVLSLGTKFIPKWSTTKTKNTFCKFRGFKNQMNAKVFFSESETKPGVFERNKKFRLKSNFVPPTEYTAVNNFCWNVRDAINVLFEKDIMEKQNLSNNDLVIHIRGGDLFFLPEPPINMNQAPFSFYKKVIEMQQFDKIYVVYEDFLNPNVQLLKDTYENVILIDDLQMAINLLLSAKNIVSCGITTFSRMLALCSENIEKHYIPGFFDGKGFNISPLTNNTDVEQIIINVDEYFKFGKWRWNNDLSDFKERFIKNN